MVWHAIKLIYSTLSPEDTWMEATHTWVLVLKSGGLRGGSFVFNNMSLMMLPEDTLKAYVPLLYQNGVHVMR